LKYKADHAVAQPRQFVFSGAAHVALVDEDLPRRGLVQPGKQDQQGCFAASADHNKFAGRGAQTDVVQHGYGSVVHPIDFIQILRFQQCHAMSLSGQSHLSLA
jgi:hypothetical protein